jgi:hypothetical protein
VKLIDRTFAIAAKLVTVAEYRRFAKGHTFEERYAPTPDCPVISVSWFQTAAYCNWLSKQEGLDASKAFDAIHALAGAQAAAVTLIKARLHPAATVNPEIVQRLIADLDSDQFDARKKASTELENIGEAAAPFLRKALDGEQSLETRKHIEDLLKKTDSATPRGEALRTIRAIEVLELVGTPEAKAVLQTLANGMPEARLTREAKAALERLTLR